MLHTQEHIDLVAMFEREFKIAGLYATKEAKPMWKTGHIYCHSETNSLFLAYRRGYAFAKALALSKENNATCCQ